VQEITIPINSAIALKTQVWLVLFACKKAGLVYKQTHRYRALIIHISVR